MDVSLAIDINKGIYALTPLNGEAKDYILANINYINYEGAILIEKDSTLRILKQLQDQGFSIEIWKSSPLNDIPEDISQL